MTGQLCIRMPSAYVSNDDAGDVAWTDPSKAASSNEDKASAALGAGESTEILEGVDCGFDAGLDPLESTDEITRIRVGLELPESGSTTGDLELSAVRLIVDGAAVGSNLGDDRSLFAGDTPRIEYIDGFATTTAAKLMQADAGLALQVHNASGGSSRTAQCDANYMLVDYVRPLEVKIRCNATSGMDPFNLHFDCIASGWGPDTRPEWCECWWRIEDEEGNAVILDTVADPRTGTGINGQARNLATCICAFNGAALLPEGSYILRCLFYYLLDGVLYSTDATEAITVAADTRTAYYVDGDGGNDDNSGLTEGQPKKTAFAVRQIVDGTSNWKMLIKRGTSGCGIPSTLNGCDNALIDWYGDSGDKPIIDRPSGGGDAIIMFGSGCTRCVVRRCQFGNTGGVGTGGVDVAVRPFGSCNGLMIYDCHFKGLFLANFLAIDTVRNFAFIRCTSDEGGTFTQASIYSDVVRQLTLIGNKFKAHASAAANGMIRLGGYRGGGNEYVSRAAGVCVLFNDLDFGGSDVAGLRLGGSYQSIGWNRLHNGNNPVIAIKCDDGAIGNNGGTDISHTTRVFGNDCEEIRVSGRAVNVCANRCKRIWFTHTPLQCVAANNLTVYGATSAIFFEAVYRDHTGQVTLDNNAMVRDAGVENGTAMNDNEELECFPIARCQRGVWSSPDTAAAGMVNMETGSGRVNLRLSTAAELDGMFIDLPGCDENTLLAVDDEDISAAGAYLLPEGLGRTYGRLVDYCFRDYRGIALEIEDEDQPAGCTGTRAGAFGDLPDDEPPAEAPVPIAASVQTNGTVGSITFNVAVNVGTFSGTIGGFGLTILAGFGSDTFDVALAGTIYVGETVTLNLAAGSVTSVEDATPNEQVTDFPVDNGSTKPAPTKPVLVSATVGPTGLTAGLVFDQNIALKTFSASIGGHTLTPVGEPFGTTVMCSIASVIYAGQTVALDLAAGSVTGIVGGLENDEIDDGEVTNNSEVPEPLPPPVVASIDPVEAQAGESGVTITVTGTDFVSGAVVSFGGTGITAGSTTFVDDTELTVDIDIALLAAIGTRDVTVTNPDLQFDTLEGAFEILAADPPEAVDTFDAALNAGRSVGFSWSSDPANATVWRVYASTDSGFDPNGDMPDQVFSGPAAQQAANRTMALYETAYYYWIRQEGPGGNSAWTAADSNGTGGVTTDAQPEGGVGRARGRSRWRTRHRI